MTGNQVRDILHVNDLCKLIDSKLKNLKINNKLNVGGSTKSFTTLKKLTDILKIMLIRLNLKSQTSNYDIPYFITNNDFVKNI